MKFRAWLLAIVAIGLCWAGASCRSSPCARPQGPLTTVCGTFNSSSRTVTIVVGSNCYPPAGCAAPSVVIKAGANLQSLTTIGSVPNPAIPWSVTYHSVPWTSGPNVPYYVQVTYNLEDQSQVRETKVFNPLIPDDVSIVGIDMPN